MSRAIVGVVSRAVLAEPRGERSPWTDAELLRRYATGEDEWGFEVLFRRHGGMVLGLCRRLLPTQQDAEDACQATFLLLARKAGSERWTPSVANWLFTTARKVAANARKVARKRHRREGLAAVPDADTPLDRISGRELLTALDEELGKLPPHYREPLILCYLEGLTRDEAALRLGVPTGTVKIRTERGRKRLGAALTRRGCGLGAGLLSLAVIPSTDAATARLTASIHSVMAGTAPPAVTALADALTPGLKPVSLLAGLITTAVVTVGVGVALGTAPQTKQTAPTSGSKVLVISNDPKPNVDAFGDPLPKDAVARFGTNRFRVGSWPMHLAPSPDGVKLVSVGRFLNGTESLTVWESSTGRVIRRSEYTGIMTDRVSWLPDGRGFAICKVNVADYVTWEFTDANASPPSPVDRNARNTTSIGTFTTSAISPGGTFLAAGRRAGKDGNEGRLEVWPLTSNAKISSLTPRFGANTTGTFVGLAFTPDGTKVIGITQDRSPDQAAPGGRVISGTPTDKATVTVWDVANGNVGLTCEVPGMAVPLSSFETFHPYAVAADGKTLFVSTSKGRVTVLDLMTGRVRIAFDTTSPDPDVIGNQFVTHLVLTPDARTLMVAHRNRSIAGFDTQTGKERWRNRDRVAANPNSFAAMPDGKRFVIGSNNQLRFGDPNTGQLENPIPGHSGFVLAGTFADGGRTVATAGMDGTVRRWDAVSGREKSCSKIEGVEWLRWFDFAPGGQLAVGSGPVGEDSSPWTTGFFDPISGQAKTRFYYADGRPVTQSILDVPPAWLPDGSVILPVGTEAIRFGPDGKERARYSGTKPGEPTGELSSVTSSPDGRIIVLIGVGPPQRMLIGPSHVTVIDVATNAVLFRFQPAFRARGASFSSDGSAILLTGTVSQPPRPVGQPPVTLKLETAITRLDLKTFETSTPYAAPNPHADHRMTLAGVMSANGYQYAVAEADHSITVYETGSGTVRRRLTGHKNTIQRLAFSPDGTRLSSVGYDGIGLAWDMTPPRPDAKVALTDAARQYRWDALVEVRGGFAHKVMGEWMADPDGLVAYAKAIMKIVPSLSDAALNAIVSRLDSDDYSARESAAKDLDAQGSLAVAYVQSRLRQVTSAEVRKRLDAFLKEHTRPDRLSGAQLREWRVVEVLELVKTPASIALLEDIAKGGVTSMSHEAKAAVKRLRLQ